MPHPIPASPATIEGWRYFLVAIPDDDVAVSAAWAIYSELMNNWAWGLEGPEENSPLMAQIWADALFETIRIRTMGFPDLVLTYIDQIETYLQQLIANQVQDDYQVVLDQLCCANGVVAPAEDTTGEDVVVGTGDPPGEIADWPTYQTLLCSSAEKFVDSLPGWVTILEGLSLLTNVGLAAAIAGLAGGLVAAGIAATAVLGVIQALQFLEDLRDLFDLGPSWDDARTVLNTQSVKDDLICAIVLSTTAAQAETAIDAVLLGTDAYDPVHLLPLRFMMNKIFNAEADAGGYGSGCNCSYCFDEEATLGTANEGLGFWTAAFSVGTDHAVAHSNAVGPLRKNYTGGTLSCASKATLIATVQRYHAGTDDRLHFRTYYKPTTQDVLVSQVDSDLIPCCNIPTEVTVTVDLPSVAEQSHDWKITVEGNSSFGLKVYQTRLYFHD